MVALSFKLSEQIVDSLRSFSRSKGISQTKIIEESLASWIKKEQEAEIERQFHEYHSNIMNNTELGEEEAFLTNATIGDAVFLLQKEHA